MKKILIFYASYGGGHLSAAKSIQQYINDNYSDCETNLVDCMLYINKPINSITTTAYKEMAKKFPWAWGEVYSKSQNGALSKISSRSNALMAIKLLKLFKQYKPDIVITTHPFGSQMTSYLKQKGKINCKLATILTDFKSHDQWLVGKDYVDYFFVSHSVMRYSLIDSGISPNKVFATGIPISKRFLENYNRIEICKFFNLNPDRRIILLFGGGEFGLGNEIVLKVFSAFIKDSNNVQIVAISGRNDKMKEEFKNLVSNSNRENDIKILEYTDKVPELMFISDLVVTKPGGLTTSESLVSNLPMVIINPIPGQEKENAEFLEAAGIAIWIKKHDNCKLIISNLLSSTERLNEMKEKATLIAHKTATEDICKIILDEK